MTSEELSELRRSEESLWCSETRFNPDYMEQILAPDFFEFGRSGRVYQRQDILDMPAQTILDAPPLIDFEAKLIAEGVALVTYVSEVRHNETKQFANRSSVWCKAAHGWQIKFHQGTPFTKEH